MGYDELNWAVCVIYAPYIICPLPWGRVIRTVRVGVGTEVTPSPRSLCEDKVEQAASVVMRFGFHGLVVLMGFEVMAHPFPIAEPGVAVGYVVAPVGNWVIRAFGLKFRRYPDRRFSQFPGGEFGCVSPPCGFQSPMGGD